MKRIALIACDNGLGHVRRCYLIGLEFAKKGWKVNLYAPEAKFNKFVLLFEKHHLLTNVNFSTATSVKNIQSGAFESLNWHKRLPDMGGYDIVLSDNLPEILNIRPDAVLSGHFFWHDVLTGLQEKYVMESRALLYKHQPLMIASELFASDEVRRCLNYKPVGLYCYGSPTKEALNGNALLITGGTTPAARELVYNAAKTIMERGPDPFKTIFIDQSLLDNDKQNSIDIDHNNSHKTDWIQVARFDKEMYQNTICAICRPGIGTITDLLQHGGRPICIYENNNKEVFNNAYNLQKHGLCENLGADMEKLECLYQYLNNAFLKKQHSSSLDTISFDGATKLMNLLAN